MEGVHNTEPLSPIASLSFVNSSVLLLSRLDVHYLLDLRMKFSLGVFALGASVVQALLPPEVLLSEINSITERVELLIEPAEAITIQNAQQMVIQSGPLFVSLPRCNKP